MSMRKRDWLTASMHLLVEQGVDGITIANLTDHLKVSKGSFYHHFRDIADFREQMLALCLEESTTRVFAQVEAGATPLERLSRLERLAAANDPLEVVIRAWALRDAQASQTLTEIDQRRLTYIQSLFEANGLSSPEAGEAARLFYAFFIGALHLLPPLAPEHMQAAFDALRRTFGVGRQPTRWSQ